MSDSFENIVIKQPIKHLEIPINKFNNVAIPYHLNSLKQHKGNIEKFQNMREWDKVYKEQVSASRLVKQLKQLLYEMDMLRDQVLDSDITKFDELTANSRTNIMNAIKEYLELEFNLPASKPASPEDEDQAAKNPFHDSYVQLHTEHEELERQQACLHAWNSLQDDMQQLHQLFVDFSQIVHEQGELVNKVEDNIEETEVNVTKGVNFLEKASKYKVAAYPIAGALIGTCAGGPIGLIAGLKLGSLTAIGCGVLGFSGGAILKKRHMKMQKEEKEMGALQDGEQSNRKFVSLAENLKDSNKQL